MRKKFTGFWFSLFALTLIVAAGLIQIAQSQTFFPSASANDIRGFTMTNANSGTINIAQVTITALNLNRSAIPGAHFKFYLSEATNGYAVTTTAGTSSGLVHKSGYGSVDGAVAASYAVTAQLSAIANSSGQFRITAAPNIGTSLYPVAFSETTGIRAVGTLLTASYSVGNFGDGFFDRSPLQQLAMAISPKRSFLQLR